MKEGRLTYKEGNLGYLFYKKMYEVNPNRNGLNQSFLINKKVTESLLSSRISPFTQQGDFDLETTYPGLLLGTGYQHGIDKVFLTDNKNQTDIKVGFYFDYTTGMPVIPGSSIKGTIRSAFEHPRYVNELLSQVGATPFDKMEAIQKLEKSFFECGDVYFDAYPIGNISMDFDYWTPHDDNPTIGPNPIKLLRVKPGVVYRFQFIIKDESILNAEQKRKFIKKVILDLGLGAKTNHGYGYFREQGQLK